MIEIHWLWIPLIVFMFFALLAYIFEDPHRETGPITLLTSIIGFIALAVYIGAGIGWLFTHIKIIK